MFKIDYTNYKNESKKDKGKDKEQNNLKNQINGITKRKRNFFKENTNGKYIINNSRYIYGCNDGNRLKKRNA